MTISINDIKFAIDAAEREFEITVALLAYAREAGQNDDLEDFQMNRLGDAIDTIRSLTERFTEVRCAPPAFAPVPAEDF